MSIKSDSLKRSVPLLWSLPDEFSYSIEVLQRDYSRALERTPFSDQGQLLMTARNPQEQDPYKDMGSLYSMEKKQYEKYEHDFNYFMDIYRDLIFFRVYDDLKKYSPFPLGRARLMRLRPRSCYSMHHDSGLRFHLAIRSNPQCYICFKDSGAFHIPADGNIYGTNTLMPHTAMNCSLEDRVHFVISTTWDDLSGENFIKNIGNAKGNYPS